MNKIVFALWAGTACASLGAAEGFRVGPEDFESRRGFVRMTEPQEIPPERPDAKAVFEFVCRGPVSLSGVTVVGMDAAGKTVHENFLWPSLKAPAREEWGRPSRHFMTITPAMYGEKAVKAALKLNFECVPQMGSEPPVCEFTKAGIVWSPTLKSTKTGNWFTLGEDVVFRGLPPAGKTGLRVKVTDADGATAFANDVLGAEWRWRPPQVGFYTATFAWLDADGKADPVVDSFGACGHRTQKGAPPVRTQFVEFPRDRQCFAVSPSEPRAVADATPMFGFNLSPGSAVSSGDRNFALIRLLGMHAFIRYHHFPWDEIERAGRGKRRWTDVDRAFDLARRNGYGLDRILVNTFGTPKWLTSAPADVAESLLTRTRYFAPKDMAPWHDFVKAFVERYPGIRYFELWNEPHLPGFSIFWQKSSPQQFVDLMKAGYTGVKEANPDVTVLMGGQGMRYLPFYEEYVKLGGVKWFDQVDTHCGYNMQHFREAERRLGAESKPYWEGEWHTVLYNCSAPEIPSEETCAYRMLINMAALLQEGYRRITGFGLLCGEHTPESAPFYAKQQGIQQVSGLFRTLPHLEPRLAALALRTATDRFRGEIVRLGAWAFAEDGSQRLAAFGSDAGRMAFAWSANPKMKTGGWTDGFLAAVRGKRILDWTGRETKPEAMRPMRVYFVLDPDLDAAACGVKLEHLDFSAYNYRKPDTLMRGGYAPLEHPMWNACRGGDVAFAADLGAETLRLAVKARGDRLEKLTFAVDVTGKGNLDDVAEFLVTADGTIVKPRTPALMGDIPVEFSPAGVPLTKSKLVRECGDGEETWRIDIAMSDLYPFIPSPARTLNVLLIVHGGKGAAQWGDGWGRLKNPAEFGVLRPSGRGRLLVSQGDIRNSRCGVATITAGEVVRVKANGRIDDVGPSIGAKVVPGSRVRMTGSVRGNCSLTAAAWLQDAEGRKAGRVEPVRSGGKRASLRVGPDWTPFDCLFEIPPNATEGSFRIYAWREGSAEFEIRDFKLVNE